MLVVYYVSITVAVLASLCTIWWILSYSSCGNVRSYEFTILVVLYLFVNTIVVCFGQNHWLKQSHQHANLILTFKFPLSLVSESTSRTPLVLELDPRLLPWLTLAILSELKPHPLPWFWTTPTLCLLQEMEFALSTFVLSLGSEGTPHPLQSFWT